jgi:vacuolar-type H+-ATPase subunit E/Vma4
MRPPVRDTPPLPGVPPEVAHFAALIRDQADAELEQIGRDAAQRAQRIRDAADAEIAAIDADARHAGEERGRRQAAALFAEVETRGQREYLLARERLLDEAFRRVAAQLGALPAQLDALEPLARLVDEGLAALPREPVRVRVAQGYEALLGLLLAARLAGTERPYRVEAGDIPGGGVIVETDSGRLCFDNSFAARLRRLNDELRSAAAAILFAD